MCMTINTAIFKVGRLFSEFRFFPIVIYAYQGHLDRSFEARR